MSLMRKDEHRPSQLNGQLGDDVCRGAKPVQAERSAAVGHCKGAIAYQAGAQQRGRKRIVVLVGQGKAIALMCSRILGKPAIPIVSGKTGPVAQVRAPATAKGTDSAGAAKRGHAYSLARRKPACQRSGSHGAPYDYRAIFPAQCFPRRSQDHRSH